MKTTLFLKQQFPFSAAPVSVELEDERILCNDIQLPTDGLHPGPVKLWVIGNEYGAMGAVWASCEGDAIDELIDQDLARGILIEEEDADEETARGGNASEPYDTEHLWMAPVSFDPARDFKTIVRLAEARGACVKNLGDL